VTVPRNEPQHSAPLRVFVVPHTHWDREWYHVAPRFRQRLVALVDALLVANSGPFLLDGQAITLRDYLSVRPEAEPALREKLQGGTLEAGPWYVLADNLIPSGEALVRNLEAGRRVLAHFGAAAPRVAYCPDTFGHPAALPTVAAGFGLPVAVVWRGAGGSTHPTTDLFHWQAPDGSRVLTHHLPPDGYEFGSALPVTAPQVHARWARLEALWRERAASGVALLLNGADHHARQPDLAAAIDGLQQAAGAAAHFAHASLSQWATHIEKVAGTRALPTVQGELRDSYGYTWTLAGTYATRAHQKRRNARLERGLLRDVEPWIALARLRADDPSAHAAAVDRSARITLAQLPALLHRTWEDLLATHPHDTLCGCSIDAVARAMDVQQEAVAEQGTGLRDAALQLLLGHDPVSAREQTSDFDWRRLVIRNRAPRTRGGLAEVTLLETLTHVPVGPIPVVAAPVVPAPVVAAPAEQASALPAAPTLPLHQPLSTRSVHLRRESPQHYPHNDLVRARRLLLWVPPVPPLGLDAWDAARWHATHEAPPFPLTVERRDTHTTISNGRIALQVDAQARTLSLSVDDRELRNVVALEVQHDAGDSYTPSRRGTDERLRCVRARIVATGPLRATVRLWWRTASTGKQAGPQGRIHATTDLSLEAMSPVLQCHVRGTSRRTDHRLQLVWHTDVQGGRSWADAAFGPVRRDPIHAPSHARETVPATMPMHRWAMHASPMFGATMIADGLAEAEVRDQRMALTLVRAVGELSCNTLPERPGHAGWPSPTPAAQCLGAFSARSALFLHGPMSDDVLSRVRDACDDVLLPLVGETWRDLQQAGRYPGPEIIGEAYELSAFTLSASDDAAVIVRVVNNTPRSAWGTLRFPDEGPWEVTPCRLDETPLGESELVRGSFSFEGAARAVLTVRVKRASQRLAT
jgi:mannosylglycerate hydrolase